MNIIIIITTSMALLRAIIKVDPVNIKEFLKHYP